jgi:hypothetical protein
VKLVAEYLEQALQFERMAQETEDVALKDGLLKQAAAYRKLAEKRAAKVGMPVPPQSK